VSFVCDTGTRYLSKVYNDQWMIDQGLLHRQTYGDLRDIVSRRFADGTVVSVNPDDTLLTAFQRMRQAEVSQVPVIEQDRVVGLLDESDILLKVHGDATHFRALARDTMTQALETLAPSASLDHLTGVLYRGLVAIIADEQQFYGLITRFDLLNHLRRTLQ